MDQARLLSFFLSSPHKQSVLVNFSDLFSFAFHHYLLHVLLSPVCSWGFAVYASASGRGAVAGGLLRRCGWPSAEGEEGVVDGLEERRRDGEGLVLVGRRRRPWV